MRRSAILPIVLALALAGCGSTAPTGRNAAYVAADLETPARATATLGVEMLRKLPAGNVVFSPDSVAATVAMAGEGARGETAAQIVATLHAGSVAGLGAFGQLQTRILAEQAAVSEGAHEPEKLSIANGLFVQRSFPLEQPFVQSLQAGFGAAPQTVDFEGHIAEAEKLINEWVSARTAGEIPSIATGLPPATLLALANAVYLQALWPKKLDEAGTGLFQAPGRRERVPMMGETAEFRYGRGPGYTAISMPYASSTLSLLVVLPDRGGSAGVAKVERGLSAHSLSALTARMRTQPVALTIPRFHIAAQEQLGALLSALGMPRAFSEGADFQGVTEARALKIGEVIHAADIRVNERGTTAAAATLLTFEPLSATRYLHLVRFDANRPFLFFVRDDRTDAVLFAGRLADAAAAPTPAPGVSPNAKP